FESVNRVVHPGVAQLPVVGVYHRGRVAHRYPEAFLLLGHLFVRLAEFGDVQVNADPTADAPSFVAHRPSASGDVVDLSVWTDHLVLDLPGRTVANGVLPRFDRRSHIVRWVTV